MRTISVKSRVKLSAIGSADRQILHWQPVCQCRNLSICTAKLTEILWQCRNLSICTATINGINGFPHVSAETCISALLKIKEGKDEYTGASLFSITDLFPHSITSSITHYALALVTCTVTVTPALWSRIAMSSELRLIWSGARLGNF